MLPRSQRLTTALFSEVFRKGRLIHFPLFTMKVTKGDGVSRFAVSVSKKVAKTAVERNKIRRRVYSAIRDVQKKKKVAIPVNIVFIPKSTMLKTTVQDVQRGVLESFVKSGILE